jgi:hypothetical protein
MRRRSVGALGAALLAFAGWQGSAVTSPPKGFLSQYEWPSDDPRLGGLSALELSDDGTGVTILSDQGAWSQGVIARNAAGLISGITLSRFETLKGKTDAPLGKGRTDSEGLAIAPDGTAYVSFEGVARVLRYAELGGLAENLPSPPEFTEMQTNSALEALAIGPDGALYTMPERSGDLAKPFPIYRFKKGVWDHDLSLPRSGDFLPTGADFGPDGKLYVLERDFHGLMGFASRLTRYEVGGAGLGAGEVMFQSPTGFHDNLEGVAIWRDTAGHLRATMVADNNFLPFLSSGLVEYRLPD